MPTIEDAIRVLTDPANRGMPGSSEGMVLMAPAATLGALQAMGADYDTAVELARTAVEQLGGRLTVHVRQAPSAGPRRWGRPVTEEEIWVPAAALRA